VQHAIHAVHDRHTGMHAQVMSCFCVDLSYNSKPYQVRYPCISSRTIRTLSHFAEAASALSALPSASSSWTDRDTDLAHSLSYRLVSCKHQRKQ
jgi:hypothetical protein